MLVCWCDLLQRAQLQLQELKLQRSSTEKLVSTTVLGDLCAASALGMCILYPYYSVSWHNVLQVAADVVQTLHFVLSVKASL